MFVRHIHWRPHLGRHRRYKASHRWRSSHWKYIPLNKFEDELNNILMRGGGLIGGIGGAGIIMICGWGAMIGCGGTCNWIVVWVGIWAIWVVVFGWNVRYVILKKQMLWRNLKLLCRKLSKILHLIALKTYGIRHGMSLGRLNGLRPQNVLRPDLLLLLIR